MRILLPVVVVSCGLFINAYPLLSQTWAQIGTNGVTWLAVASSADGSSLVALGRQVPVGEIFTSTNSGFTWILKTNIPGVYNWYSAASSADGLKLVGVAATGQIYASTNAGDTWLLTSAPSERWQNVVSSADGNRLAATASSVICTSTNSGLTWRTNSPAGGGVTWSAVASSADGTRLIFAPTSGPIYTSADSGDTWAITTAPSTNWYCVASSADGARLVAAVGGPGPSGSIYISTDFGATWTMTVAPVANWSSVAISAEGSRLAAGSIIGAMYTSTDSGYSWDSNSVPNQHWICIASSADGSKLWALGSGSMYTSQSTPTPSLNIIPSSPNLTLSWTVPATGFLLQQNADLTTTNWIDVTNTPVLNLTNLQNEVSLPLPASTSFYRLKTL